MRSWRAAGRDEGLTLVELLVTMVVAGIFVPLLISAMLAAERSVARTMRTADVVDGVRLALQVVDRGVRSGAAPVVVPPAGTQGFGFWSAFAADGAPAPGGRCVQYRVVGDGLRTRSFAANATTRPPWASAPVLASGLTTASTFTTDAAATSVGVVLEVQEAGGRSARVRSALAPRNSTTPEVAAPCASFD